MIPKNDQIAFLNKIIDKTKSSDLHWEAVPFPGSFYIFQREAPILGNIFSCEFSPNSKLFMAQMDGGRMLGRVGSNIDYTESLDVDDDSVHVLLLRLYNIVSEILPPPRSLIRDFLEAE